MPKPNVTKPVWAGKFQLVPLALFVVTLSAFSWSATQEVARQLAYQSQLGAPWFEFFGQPLYKPWQAIAWSYGYYYYAPELFKHGLRMIALGGIIAMLTAVLYAIWVSRRARIATSYGTARWASPADIAASGLLGGQGVIVGLTQEGHYLQHDSGQHVLSVAPTGSGKGVGQIIPTLLSWPASVVVHDIKGENWEITAGYRSTFSNVLYFNPCSLQSCHFNPLFEIRPGIYEVRDAQNIVAMLIDPLGKKDLEFWEREATTLLVACLLHVLYCEPNKTLAGVAYFLADPDRTAPETIQMMRMRQYPNPRTTKFINSSAQQAAQKYEKELSGVISSCLSVLGLYRDPLIEEITADSDFRISDLVESEHPVSLYMIIPSSDDIRITPLVRLLWSQIGRRLMERHPSQGVRETARPRSTLQRIWPWASGSRLQNQEKPKRHKMLLMMDEFPTLGYMEIFQTAIAKIRSYGVTLFIVTQSNNQIEEVYGPKHPFTSNCTVRTFYTPNDNPTAEAISIALGTQTEVHQQKTYTGHRFVPMLGHVMVADQEVARPLLTTGEVLSFGNEEAIIFVTGGFPIRARKLRYFEDRNLIKRVLPKPILSEARPYLYRPKPQPNPWFDMPNPGVEKEAVPVAYPAPRGANEEPAPEQQICSTPEELEHSDHDLGGPDLPDMATRDLEFEQWHQSSVAATALRELDVDDAERRATQGILRAAFDAQQLQRSARKAHERQVKHDPDRGR